MKRNIIPSLLLALCLLCACGETKGEVSPSAPAAPKGADGVYAEGLLYRGKCTAGVENGEYQGSGTFSSNEGWQYTGSFKDGEFDTGTVEGLPCTITWSNSYSSSLPARLSGTYSGEVSQLKPSGQGSFTDEQGGSFQGSFLSGFISEGQAENLRISLPFGSEKLEGTYTGAFRNGACDGEGSFTALFGRELSYEGGFQNGLPFGNGMLRDTGYLCQNGNEKNRGLYEGSTLHGLPHGEGSFTGRNSENIDYSYTGEWEEGLFHGAGSLVYESQLYYKRIGHFTKGAFTPQGLEILDALSSAGASFTMSDNTRAYVEKFPELLKADTQLKRAEECDYRGEYSPLLNFKNYYAQPENFDSAFMYVFNSKIIYRRMITVLGEETPISCFVGANPLYQEPVVCYIVGSFSGFGNANVFNCYGIPLGKTTYTNANGDAVEAIALLVGGITTY